MKFNIISNLMNGAGLQRSYEILRFELERRGHYVNGVQFNAANNVQQVDVNVFIETVRPELFRFAKKQWTIPMPEWWDVRWFDLNFNRVLALTHDCHRLFSKKFGDRCTYLGWRAKELYDPKIQREKKFLHVAGKSPYKNTAEVLRGGELAGVSITVVGERKGKRRVTDEELKYMMNSHLFHLMPSAYEGYGYVLHEALGVGAVLITTNAPPMNEVQPSILIRSVGTIPRHATVLHKVLAEDIASAINHAMQLKDDVIDCYHRTARHRFLYDEAEFHMNLDKLLTEESC